MDSESTSEPPGRVISPGGGGDGEAPAAGVVEGSNGSPTVGPVEQPGEPDGNIGPAMFPSEGQTVIPRSQSSPVMDSAPSPVKPPVSPEQQLHESIVSDSIPTEANHTETIVKDFDEIIRMTSTEPPSGTSLAGKGNSVLDASVDANVADTRKVDEAAEDDAGQRSAVRVTIQEPGATDLVVQLNMAATHPQEEISLSTGGDHVTFQEPVEPNSGESATKSSHSGERSLAESEMLSHIEDVADWAQEEQSEPELEESEEEEGQVDKESLDGDRDPRNGAYIPRGGNYFLHDDRSAELPQEPEPVVATEGAPSQPESDEQPPKSPGKILKNKPGLKSEVGGGDRMSARWEHDLFAQDAEGDQTVQGSNGGRYDYGGRGRGQRNLRFRDGGRDRGQQRPPRGVGYGRGPRGPGRARGGGFRGAANARQDGGGGYYAKENDVPMKEEVKERLDVAPQEPRQGWQKARGGGLRGRAFARRGGYRGETSGPRESVIQPQSAPSTPRYQDVEDWDLHEARPVEPPETDSPRYPPRGHTVPDRPVPPKRPAYRTAQSYADPTPAPRPSYRNARPDPAPRRYQQPMQYDREYDEYEEGTDSSFQSRVFFSRGRVPPQSLRERGGSDVRENVGYPRNMAANNGRFNAGMGGVSRPRFPVPPPPQPAASSRPRFGNQNASRNIPVPPPIIIEQQSSAPTKRYSRRPNVSTRIDDVSEQSGDVRVAGIGRQDYPVYQNSRQMNYNSYQGNSSHYPGNYGNQQYQHNHSMESQGYYAHPTHTGMEYPPPQQHVYYQQNENYY